MKAFAELYTEIDESNRTNDKVAALARFFASASPADAMWAVYFLIGRKPKQLVGTRKLREWAAEEAGVTSWLFDESYDAVGDLSEAIALLLPPPTATSDRSLCEWVEEVLLPLKSQADHEQKARILEAWRSMDGTQRFVWNKLLSGAFRVGVSSLLVTRALAKVSGIEPAVVAHRLMGDWQPTPEFFTRLVAAEAEDADLSRPYPFSLAYALEDGPEPLGNPAHWQAEWKWDGIRSQVIHRRGEVFVWSRGEELVTDRYPELSALASMLPDGTVIDGEILPWKDGAPLPFAQLQRRIGRKTLGKKILAEVPVVLVGYDLIEHEGQDVRSRPLEWRREMLVEIVSAVNRPTLRLSPLVEGASWDALAEQRSHSREIQAEGLMLKRIGSPYKAGRQKGDWWKWKVNPFTIDAVLTAAQRGSGKRASLYTDYTFSLWDQGRLVPIAKAYSGLTDEEIGRVDRFVRKHMIDKFGPVRTVHPELVFELGFEGIQESSRHKSGVAVRFPRILRWRVDKKAADADTLDRLKALLPVKSKTRVGQDEFQLEFTAEESDASGNENGSPSE